MARHFSKLFWGLLLVMLDFSIEGFDLLPDGLGYLIVAAGCFGLVPLSEKFLAAGLISLALTGLWVFSFVIPHDVRTWYPMLMGAFDCAQIWMILGGIGNYALSRSRPDLAKRAANRRLAYLFLMIIMNLFGLMLRDAHDAACVIIVMIVIGLILAVMILHLILRVRRELALRE